MMPNESTSYSFTCPQCKSSCRVFAETKPDFCPFCSTPLPPSATPATPPSSPLPQPLAEPTTIGPYELIHSIGKGGMGEVFLAYDTSCGRRIALKKIRADLKKHPQLHHRFLKEALITSQLTHPAIIPIYTIHQDDPLTYYTMPFVEGETLKQIIRKTRQQEKKGEPLHHIGGSIPALIRIFFTICQAVAYAHSKGVLHRDLKPENIIIGKYGEVLILDWGLAKLIDRPDHPSSEEDPLFSQSAVNLPKQIQMTRIGKVVGTVAYMAPEIAFGHPATAQTDIYSLGVILYQLLALRNPFKRGTLEEFKKTVQEEEFIDPILVSPYRDVPRLLSQIAQKCLTTDKTQRYSSVDELIHDLENYIEGRSEWFHIASLDVKAKQDWEFQETVLIAGHMAITRITEEAEWVILMISRSSFAGNTKIEADVCLGEDSHGIGFLLSIPESAERRYIDEGYCLWLGSDMHRSTKLLRSNVEVMVAPDIFLRRHQWHRIRIEKTEETIHVYIDETLKFSYIAHIPLIGTHLGLLSRDADFMITPLNIYVGNLNLTVNCLAVPDAFLAHRDFKQALSEYHRIANSFPDRVEGREAVFRAGLTFIEQAKENKNKKELLDQSLQEFEKLHGTPGAPLEYLGKALVYQVLGDYEEEIKCFEIAYRRYPHHPLLPILQEQVLSRMHELSRQQRIATYNFILLALRHLSVTMTDTHTRKLFASLQKHWEHLPFIEENLEKDRHIQNWHFAIQLAFWVAKPYALSECIDQMRKETHPSLTEIGNALFSLIELGSWKYAKNLILELKEDPQLSTFSQWPSFDLVIGSQERDLKEIFNEFFLEPSIPWTFSALRALLYVLDQALDRRETIWIHGAMQKLQPSGLSFDDELRLNTRWIRAYLLDDNWEGAGELIKKYPAELLNKETTALHFLYGCWLQATEGTEMGYLHFSNLLHVSYPRSWTLAGHYLINDLTKEEETWFNKAFLWEKRHLYRDLSLYYHCAGEEEKEQEFQNLYRQQFITIES